jgi:hypothetical protein
LPPEAEAGSIGRVGISDLGPALLVISVAAYAIYYFVRARSGGAAGDHHEEWRREFGFGPDERLTRAWFGVMYVGPLRPDTSYATLRVNPRIIGMGMGHATGMPESTGLTCRVALSDRGSLGVSLEVGDDSGAAEQLESLIGASSGMVPLQRFGPEPRPGVLGAREAFGRVAGWQSAVGTAPRMRGASGALVTYELVHIVGPELPAGLTLWLDPDGVRQLEHWSQASAPIAAQAS